MKVQPKGSVTCSDKKGAPPAAVTVVTHRVIQLMSFQSRGASIIYLSLLLPSPSVITAAAPVGNTTEEIIESGVTTLS